MGRTRTSLLVKRILHRLEQAELHEPDPHRRDDLRIAWITVYRAARGIADAHVHATYMVLGLHPDKVWPAIVERRKTQLGRYYDLFYPDLSLPLKKPAQSERGRKERSRESKIAVGERSDAGSLKGKRREPEFLAPPQPLLESRPAMSSIPQTDYRKRAAANSEKNAASAPPEFGTPPRALLYWKKLTRTELSVLHAMLEGNSSGEYLYPSIPRIAFYAKLSERTVQAVIHGEHRKRKSTSTYRPRSERAGLKDRHILRELAPYNATAKKAAVYRLQIEALENDQAMVETAIQRRWKMPPEIVAELSDEQKSRIQTVIEFPVDDMEIEKWGNGNQGAWKRFQRDLTNAAEARVGAPAHSEASMRAHWMALARRNKIPDRISRALIARWKE